MLIRNAATVAPALHSGVVLMAEPSGQWPDAAKAVDEFCVSHLTYVRKLRTERNPFSYVSENVETARKIAGFQLRMKKVRKERI